jgi:hypothetical protein
MAWWLQLLANDEFRSPQDESPSQEDVAMYGGVIKRVKLHSDSYLQNVMWKI